MLKGWASSLQPILTLVSLCLLFMQATGAEKNKIKVATLFGKSWPACVKGGRRGEERQPLMPNIYFAMSPSIIPLLFAEMPWTEHNGPATGHHSQAFDESGFSFCFMTQRARRDEFSGGDTDSTCKTDLLFFSSAVQGSGVKKNREWGCCQNQLHSSHYHC